MTRARGGARVAVVVALAAIALAWLAASFPRVGEDEIALRVGAGGPVPLDAGRSFVPFGIQRVVRYDPALRDTDLGEDGVLWTTPEGATIPFRARFAWRVDPSAAAVLHEATGSENDLDAWFRDVVADTLAVTASGEDAPAVGTGAFRDRFRERLAARLASAGVELVAVARVRDLPDGASPVPRAADPERDVLVIGLDGADWDLIDPLLARGEMPHLARLVEGGARARLRTVQPILSPVVWTSAATGKTPDKHGIYDFLATAPDGSPVPVTRTLWRARPVWDVLGDAGVDVAVTAWWATWPAEPVRGYLVSDRIAYQLFDDVVERDDDSATGKTWPPGLYDDVRRSIVRPEDVSEADLAGYVDLAALGDRDDDDRERLDQLRTILASTRTYEAIATGLLERRPSGFHAVYHEATDTVAHLFMPHRPPPAAGVDPRRAAAFGGAVDAAYRAADALIGRLLARVDDGWNVVVMSDHGFKHGTNRPATESRTDRAAAADWHDRFGVLVLHGPGVRPGAVVDDASILDVAPTLLALYGLPVPDDLDGRVLTGALDVAALVAPATSDVATYELPGEDGGGVAIASGADAAMIERLRSLGYIGGGVSGDGSGGDDGAAYAQEGARALNHRGIALLARGDRDGAMAAFREALASGGGVGSLVNIARLQLASRDVEGARETLRTLERGGPDFPQLPALHGWLADLEGDAGAARRHLEAALAIAPTDSHVLARLGHLDERAGDLDAAVLRYRAAIRADPENALAHTYLGNVLRVRGRLDEAEAAYRAAVDADPRSPGGINNLGLMLQASGRIDEAIALYRQGLAHVPDSAILRNSLAAALVQSGDLEGAEREARRAIEHAPDLSEARVNLGIALAGRGRLDDATAAFRDAVRIDPANPDGWFNLARARLLAGDREGALEGFARASDLEPDGFEPAVGAAEIALALGRTADARRYFERAAGIRPDSERARARLAELDGGGGR